MYVHLLTLTSTANVCVCIMHNLNGSVMMPCRNSTFLFFVQHAKQGLTAAASITLQPNFNSTALKLGRAQRV